MENRLKDTTKQFIELNGFRELTAVQTEVLKYSFIQNRHWQDSCLSDSGYGEDQSGFRQDTGAHLRSYQRAGLSGQ